MVTAMPLVRSSLAAGRTVSRAGCVVPASDLQPRLSWAPQDRIERRIRAGRCEIPRWAARVVRCSRSSFTLVPLFASVSSVRFFPLILLATRCWRNRDGSRNPGPRPAASSVAHPGSCQHHSRARASRRVALSSSRHHRFLHPLGRPSGPGPVKATGPHPSVLLSMRSRHRRRI